ncbi:MAG TPA: Tudor-knot domain-containing protein, partial [Tepidisphaeraceae bacterium]|nr:Tudor-knot domain-containing protein [Tepidisphaeraceae bacterium]
MKLSNCRGGACVGWALVLGGVLWLFCPSLGAAESPLAEGQKVQVREGDAWSAATILKHEGRKYLIHYEGADASADEWVTTDRIRAKGTAGAPALPGSPAAPMASQPAAAPKPAAAKLPVFQIGQKVEYKWGGLWKKATVTNRRGEWYFMTDEHGSREWVEPWRVRAAGSQEDNIGYARPNPTVRHGEGPPQPVPGPASEPFGARRHADPAKLAEEAAPDVPLTQIDRAQVKKISLDGAPPLAQLAADAAPRP